MKKILVVDDEVDLAMMIKTRLEANGFEVMTASNGKDGLIQWKKASPDLIILDITMPGMDGYTFIQESKSQKLPEVPIIVLTAKPGMKDIFKVEGARDYIVKPFNNTELLEKINHCLKG